ncbi:MAG: hypothetical protein AAGF12_32485 [Myxococcota bacterium]
MGRKHRLGRREFVDTGRLHGAMLTGTREAERLLGREGLGGELESELLIQLGCNEEA